MSSDDTIGEVEGGTKWFYALLIANTTLMGLLPTPQSGLDSCIFSPAAPVGTPYPLVTLQCVPSVGDLLYGDGSTAMVSLDMYCKFWAESSDETVATTGAHQIEKSVRGQLGSDTHFKYNCVRIQTIHLPFFDKQTGKWVVQSGGRYRVFVRNL